MAATDRDYYELLGVSRDADEAEIKHAFRKLARELHPDVSDAPDAEARFKEVVEAYEVLSNCETRALYDRYGHAGLRSGGFQPSHFDFGNLGDLFSAFFGDDVLRRPATRRARSGRRSRGRDRARRRRHGVTKVAFRSRSPSPARPAAATASSPGRSRSAARAARAPAGCSTSRGASLGQFVRTQACPQCAGRGIIVEHPCHACAAAGLAVESREIEVEIPAGIHDGQRIRVSGEGHAGELGGRSATPTSRCASGPTRASCARATTSTRRST